MKLFCSMSMTLNVLSDIFFCKKSFCLFEVLVLVSHSTHFYQLLIAC